MTHFWDGLGCQLCFFGWHRRKQGFALKTEGGTVKWLKLRAHEIIRYREMEKFTKQRVSNFRKWHWRVPKPDSCSVAPGDLFSYPESPLHHRNRGIHTCELFRLIVPRTFSGHRMEVSQNTTGSNSLGPATPLFAQIFVTWCPRPKVLCRNLQLSFSATSGPVSCHIRVWQVTSSQFTGQTTLKTSNTLCRWELSW